MSALAETDSRVSSGVQNRTEKQLLVSVILSNFNHGKYLEQALAGILRQSYWNFELIITDDGSSDNSRKLIEFYAARDRRIKAEYFPKNRGAMAATANNMRRVKGQLIYGAGADDFVLDEHFFQKAVDALKSFPTAAGFYGVAGLYSAEKNCLVGSMGSAPIEGLLTPEVFLPSFLTGQSFVPGNSSIWRLDVFNALGGWDYSLGPQIDYYINHALPLQHGVVFTRTPVSCQRVYEENTNYGSKGNLWEACARYAKVEEALRPHAKPYEGIEKDWAIWRAKTAMNCIEKTGVKV